ncbi:unnamed protein product, partial [Schistosoma turkestanicum]
SLLRHNLTTRLAIPCVDDTVIRSYLNSPIVRRFINVKLNLPKEWDVCSDLVNTNYVRLYLDLTEQYMKLLKSKINVLIYNGDIDMACNYFGDEWFVDNLNLTTTSTRTPWLYIEKDGTKQIGGYWKVLSANVSNLVYTTVRGAGHMVPEDKPAAAFHMINRFINAKIVILFYQKNIWIDFRYIPIRMGRCYPELSQAFIWIYTIDEKSRISYKLWSSSNVVLNSVGTDHLSSGSINYLSYEDPVPWPSKNVGKLTYKAIEISADIHNVTNFNIIGTRLFIPVTCGLQVRFRCHYF